MLNHLEKGDLDAAIIFRNESLAESVHYLSKVSESEVSIWSNKKKVITNLDSFPNMLIGTINGASFGELYDLHKNVKKIKTNNYSQGLQMLKLNRLDGVIGSDVGVLYWLSKSKFDLDEFPKPLRLKSKDWWMHFSKKSKKAQLMKKLKEGINKIYKKDLIMNIYNKNYNNKPI
jgi:polar amino acid transport system substrate-binding protein